MTDFEIDVENHVVPFLPTFKIGEFEYVLLHDVQAIFNLREDFALAALVQSCKLDVEVGIDDDKLQSLEDNFNSQDCLSMCFKEACQSEEHHQINEESFQALQAEMKLETASESLH